VRLAWCFGFSAGWGSGSCLGAWSCVLVSVLGDFACWPVLAGGGFVLVSFSEMEISFICVKKKKTKLERIHFVPKNKNKKIKLSGVVSSPVSCPVGRGSRRSRQITREPLANDCHHEFRHRSPLELIWIPRRNHRLAMASRSASATAVRILNCRSSFVCQKKIKKIN
jgi:hypothetical protein